MSELVSQAYAERAGEYTAHLGSMDAVHHADRHAAFDIGSVDSLDAAAGSLGGVLSWYSLIHHEPTAIHVPLREMGLSPG